MRRATSPSVQSDMRATVDTQGIQTRFSDGRVLRIAWDDLVHVSLVWRNSADRSFWEDRGYWELQAINGTRCHVYRQEARRIALLDHLLRLPGFSLTEATRALDERGYTPVWRRDVVHCPRCAVAMEIEPQSGPRRWDRRLRCPTCRTSLALGRERSVR